MNGWDHVHRRLQINRFNFRIITQYVVESRAYTTYHHGGIHAINQSWVCYLSTTLISANIQLHNSYDQLSRIYIRNMPNTSQRSAYSQRSNTPSYIATYQGCKNQFFKEKFSLGFKGFFPGFSVQKDRKQNSDPGRTSYSTQFSPSHFYRAMH